MPNILNSQNRIFNDIGNNDYIYQVIQEIVDEATEEQFMLMIIQQELIVTVCKVSTNG